MKQRANSKFTSSESLELGCAVSLELFLCRSDTSSNSTEPLLSSSTLMVRQENLIYFFVSDESNLDTLVSEEPI